MDFDLIGIVGPIASGKGVITDYLIKEYSYTSFSLSSLVHDEAKKQGITVFTRTTLQDIGDEMRRKEGSEVLAKRAIEQFGVQKKIIIEGIRNPGEVAYLRTIPGFFLIAVDATKENRFQRVLSRGKSWDPKDWETFLQVDGRDGGNGSNKNGQQVRKCMEMADLYIENNGDIQQVTLLCKGLINQAFTVKSLRSSQ